MKNNKNVSIEAPIVLTEESLVTIPLDEFSQVYDIYNNYLGNIGKYIIRTVDFIKKVCYTSL